LSVPIKEDKTGKDRICIGISNRTVEEIKRFRHEQIEDLQEVEGEGEEKEIEEENEEEFDLHFRNKKIKAPKERLNKNLLGYTKLQTLEKAVGEAMEKFNDAGKRFLDERKEEYPTLPKVFQKHHAHSLRKAWG